MSSLSDEYDQINDDPDAHEAEPCATEQQPGSPEPDHPPPEATDFTRVTTRYMIGGREWTRANRERALDALRRAVVAWPGSFWLTTWKWRGWHPSTGTREKPGHGLVLRTTIDRYAKYLAGYSRGTFRKGEAVCTTMAASRYRGHSDEECVERSGIFMDSDECGGWDAARALSREVGLAFVGQLRPFSPNRHHLEIPLWPTIVPSRDADGAASWKHAEYMPRLGWVLGIFSELIGLRYDLFWEGKNANAKYGGYDTACDQLTTLNFVYTRRPEDPEGHYPVVDSSEGGALDVSALLAATDFEVIRANLDKPTRSATQPTRHTTFVPRTRALGLEEIEPHRISTVELLVRLRRLRNPESQVLINRLLAGEAYAPIGQRDNEMHRAASIIAALAPNEDPKQLAKLLFTKSLEAMAKVPGADPAVEPYVSRAAQKIARAQQRFGGGAR